MEYKFLVCQHVAEEKEHNESTMVVLASQSFKETYPRKHSEHGKSDLSVRLVLQDWMNGLFDKCSSC